MNKQQRTKLIEYQQRAFTEGSVECINDQWVFFDEETEEAALLDVWLHEEIEVFRLNRWRKGILCKDGKIQKDQETIHLKDQDIVRIRKNLVFSLERLLEEVNDDAFYQFITSLNTMDFSIYDCIYCYNQLTFLNDSKQKSGVNFIVFDNGELICSVHHHFTYFEQTNDRFEFTLSTGKRMVIEKIG
ncbi:DUF2777 domain-containing protein [Bacillus tuaregi]|uniref:DUF2777 domain-containing protein n=1 Tax=Bacillus tuaregi TaxID=1816695 RepID=UPI0008F80B30|nr:DUF2777 domain-containing protein [Bacillus tuaregi]